MPKITVNGQTVEVPAGSMVIEAFKHLKEPIAHYCWHPGLSVAGVCRLCMIEIEGNPRLQIACNTTVQEGMVVNNNSEKVKNTVKWGLDFHLINHPLDCPICDQAGECELQNQYMDFGRYDSEMAEPKVKKRKVVDLGERIVLDTERCILCSRCVRFTNEVSKTNELGIFDRGDRSEIGTFKDKPLNNKYSVNTVDICPVGALTSKDFRFKQRVWYLKDKPSVCTGCSTGCSIDVYYNEEGVFRIKPRHNPDVNGYWMCDEGRDIYKHMNKDSRMIRARSKSSGAWSYTSAKDLALSVGKKLKSYSGQQIAVLLTPQYTNEELETLIKYAMEDLKTNNIYIWNDSAAEIEKFDGLLIRGDKNPNTQGLNALLKKYGVGKDSKSLETDLSQYKAILVAGPENSAVYPNLKLWTEKLSKIETVVWCSAVESAHFESLSDGAALIPQKVSIEKSGTFTNFNGRVQKIEIVTTLLKNSLNLIETVKALRGEEPEVAIVEDVNTLKTNFFSQERRAP